MKPTHLTPGFASPLPLPLQFQLPAIPSSTSPRTRTHSAGEHSSQGLSDPMHKVPANPFDIIGLKAAKDAPSAHASSGSTAHQDPQQDVLLRWKNLTPKNLRFASKIAEVDKALQTYLKAPKGSDYNELIDLYAATLSYVEKAKNHDRQNEAKALASNVAMMLEDLINTNELETNQVHRTFETAIRDTGSQGRLLRRCISERADRLHTSRGVVAEHISHVLRTREDPLLIEFHTPGDSQLLEGLQKIHEQVVNSQNNLLNKARHVMNLADSTESKNINIDGQVVEGDYKEHAVYSVLVSLLATKARIDETQPWDTKSQRALTALIVKYQTFYIDSLLDCYMDYHRLTLDSPLGNRILQARTATALRTGSPSFFMAGHKGHFTTIRIAVPQIGYSTSEWHERPHSEFRQRVSQAINELSFPYAENHTIRTPHGLILAINQIFHLGLEGSDGRTLMENLLTFDNYILRSASTKDGSVAISYRDRSDGTIKHLRITKELQSNGLQTLLEENGLGDRFPLPNFVKVTHHNGGINAQVTLGRVQSADARFAIPLAELKDHLKSIGSLTREDNVTAKSLHDELRLKKRDTTYSLLPRQAPMDFSPQRSGSCSRYSQFLQMVYDCQHLGETMGLEGLTTEDGARLMGKIWMSLMQDSMVDFTFTKGAINNPHYQSVLKAGRRGTREFDRELRSQAWKSLTIHPPHVVRNLANGQYYLRTSTTEPNQAVLVYKPFYGSSQVLNSKFHPFDDNFDARILCADGAMRTYSSIWELAHSCGATIPASNLNDQSQ